jgi:glycine C-acetyltransferase
LFLIAFSQWMATLHRLPEMINVLHKYEGSVLVMDEAHASGAIGRNGRGIYEHFGILPSDAIEQGVVPADYDNFL